MNFQAKVIMVGGKGGVGKSTISSALSWYLASQGRKTLLISTDPAPSLSDLFEEKIGSQETQIKENLFAFELSHQEVLKRWKRKFGPEIYEVISSLIEIEEDIIDYVGEAPGIDEEFMLDYLISLAETEKYRHLVWDTAPTGHTLRLLTLPIRFINHLNSATRVYLKLERYLKRIKSQRSIFDIIKSWKILAEKVIHFLQDPQQMEAVIVTIPETLGFNQTEKVMAEFEKHRLHFRHLVVNYLVENPEGDFLKKKKNNQQEILRVFRKKYQEKLKLIELPLFPEEIKGLLKVEEFSKLLIKRWGGEG